MNVHRAKQYLKYRLCAKTRHGVHSPFVYAFIENILQKGDKENFKELMERGFGKDHIDWLPQSVSPDEAAQALLQHTIIIIPHIHSTPADTEQWKMLCELPEAKLSIDLFRYGVLVRNEDIKEKQHFVLKY